VNILLIQIKRIGDLILTTPAIAALRQKFPKAKITLVISQEAEPLLPALAGVDRTVVVRRNLSDIAGSFSILRQKFDYCIDFTRNDRSAFLSFLSRAPKRVVSYRVKRRAAWRGRVYNEFVQHRMRDMHTIDYNLSLIEPAGVSGTSPPVHLALPATAGERAHELLRHARIERPFIIFHPGSARAEKFWQPDRWADVISHAAIRHKVNVILTGGTSRTEQAHLAEIEAKLPRPVENSGAGSVVDLSGKMDLLTLAALIGQAQLLVTVDSAPMHLAAATATPQVVLFGPTNPYHWRPRQSPAIILQGESPAPVREFASKQPRLPMKLISTRAVIDAMNSLLSSPTK
jgi:predicted lipopolysaccharide heptosyltransferase III